MERGARLAALAGAALAVASVLCGSSGATAAKRTVTVYTVATGVEFINTADDRARGASNNPFDKATDRMRPVVVEKGNGPFAGDVAVYDFDLYPSAGLHTPVGSASYTCYFNYDRRALCIAYYLLKTFVFAAPKSQRTGIE